MKGIKSMNQLEVFFDYACPFCLRGHGYLTELHSLNPDVEIVWRPCEAHPRPESYGPHSDLCIQGMYFALGHGADIWEYHARMFSAVFEDRIDIENMDALAQKVGDMLDAEAFRKSLATGEYAKVQLAGNDYAYEQSGVWAVPSYRMNGKKLDAVEGVGVTKEQLAAFIAQAKRA